jgi:hypothetical protein
MTMKHTIRSLSAAVVLMAGLLALGCSQSPNPTASPAVVPPAATTPSPAPASPAATASPAASGSPAAASPKAGSSPDAKTSQIKWKRVEYPAAGVGFDVPDTFKTWEKADGGWLYESDDRMAIFVRSEEWKEWDEVLKACKNLLIDFKASDDEVTKARTADDIKVYYDYGVSKTKDGKAVVVAIAGYELTDHDFVMVVIGDPNDKALVENATRVFKSVTRQSKFQGKEDKKEDE